VIKTELDQLDREAREILEQAAGSNFQKQKEAELIEKMILSLSLSSPSRQKYQRLYVRDTDYKNAKNISKVFGKMHQRMAEDQHDRRFNRNQKVCKRRGCSDRANTFFVKNETADLSEKQLSADIQANLNPYAN